MDLDKKDRRLMYELSTNSRMPLTALSKKLVCSKELAHYRFEKLRNDGAFSFFSTIINPAKFGYKIYPLYIKFAGLNKSKEKEVISFFNDNKNIIWAGALLGEWDFAIEICSKGLEELRRIWSVIFNKYSAIIQKYELLISLEESIFGYKQFFNPETGSEITVNLCEKEDEKIKRKDIELLLALANDSRLSLSDVSRRTGQSVDRVKDRFRWLQDSNVINGFTVWIDLSKFDYTWCILLLKLNRKSENLSLFLKRHPQVHYLVDFIGKWDMEIALNIRQGYEIKEFIKSLFEEFPGVIKDYTFSLVTKEFKNTHFLKVM